MRQERLNGCDGAGGWSRAGLPLILTVLALLAVGLALARQWTYGPSLHWDAVCYMWAADNLASGDGLADCNSDSPMSRWAPLFPAVLAALDWLLGVHPRDSAGPLNAILFGATVLCLGVFLCRRLASPALGVCATALVATAVPLGEIASSGVSEPLFILLATLALIRADDFLRTGRWRPLVWAGLYTALAWTTRYVGVLLLAAIAALLLLRPETGPGSSWRKVSQVGAYAVVSCAPMAAWFARNAIHYGRVRDHDGSEFALLDVLAVALDVLGGWLRAETIPQSKYIPPRMRDWQDWLWRADWPGDDRLLAQADGADALAAVALACLATGVVAICLRLLLARGGRTGSSPARETMTTWRSFLAFGAFSLAYVVGVVVVSAIGSTTWGVEERHLLPAYLPLAVSAICVLDVAWRRREARKEWRWRVAAAATLLGLAACVCGSVAVALADIAAANRAARFGEGSHRYDRALADASPILQHVREHPPRAPYVTNRGMWFYAFLDIRGADARFFDLPLEKTDAELAAWLRMQPRGRQILYWGYWRDNGQRLEGMGVRRIATFESGAVFEIDGSRTP